MKSIFRLTALLALVLIALSPALTVAVNGQAMPCDGLADADCKLLQDSISADGMAKLSSFNADYTLNASVAGTDASDGNINATGSGSFAIDPTVIAALKSGAGNTDSANPLNALNGLTMQTSLKADGSFVGSQGVSFDLRSVGDNLYFKGDSIAQGKWMVINLSAALQFVQNYVALSAQNAVQSLMPGTAGAANIATDPKVQADIATLIKTPGVFKGEASDGPSVDGQATRKLTYSLDVGALVNSPEFKTLATDAVKASGQEADAAQIAASVDPVAIQEVLKDSKFQLTWLVGSNDKLLHGFRLTLAVKIQPTYVAILTNTNDAKEFDANVDLNIQLSKIGQPVKVAPVPDAKMPDIFGFFGGPQATPGPTAAQ